MQTIVAEPNLGKRAGVTISRRTTRSRRRLGDGGVALHFLSLSGLRMGSADRGEQESPRAQSPEAEALVMASNGHDDTFHRADYAQDVLNCPPILSEIAVMEMTQPWKDGHER